ncbi:carbohydrate ABC transporter permease [Microbacterium thalassium]|uniref:Multiple sugar transport system permease protein n=1 Tax=Microbacterium thalassium TaxID=362649 RepID=A0A7X0KTZ5_9MICO|nr:sugar ABC transporter permease [Microbacterium thalassium]MBB6390573.1 multiple sugar transport system permease protein [Microbacterium thalassium]GLK25684.1 ABC transporter [Microbacterium thalassium]
MSSSTLAPVAAAGESRGRGWRRYRSSTFYAFASPWIIGFVVLTLAPIIYAFVVSLTNFDGVSPIWRFIGFRNYIEIFGDANVWAALIRTLAFTAIVVPLSVAGGLGLAILVNRRIRARGLVRAIFFIPSVVPIVAVAIMWRLIFNRDAGLLNFILQLFGGDKVTWLVDPYAFYALIIMMLWGMGGGMIISLAALQDVPVELEEAARIDGAGQWRIIRHIVIPLISPVLYFQVITGVIGTLQILVQPLLLAETSTIASSVNVPQSSTLYMVEVYNEFFYNQRFGYGAAMLWVFFIFILALTLILQRISKRVVFYQVGTEAD